ncbi:MAG: hypothetical protein M8353_07320 [ANME-2 cluster archaeon]|nr:hypothetical protein [ANME-2 cluster archaeon]
MHIHRRQFIIGPPPINTIPGWVQVVISESVYLYHCPELPVTLVQDSDGQKFLILGFPIQTDAERPDPKIEIENSKEPYVIQDVYQTWAGRWVLIGRDQLHVDSSGLLGCFYHTRQNTKGETELWVSSSIALLIELLALHEKPTYSIHHAVGIDWYPPPGTSMNSILKLLPSQILELKSGALLHRRLLPDISRTLSYEDILDRLQDYLVTTLCRATRMYNRIWLPLTAGYDSRLLLATAKRAGLPVYTYTHIHPHMSESDRVLPPKLANAVGFSHSMIYGKEYRKDLDAIYDKHTGGLCVGQDKYYISHQYFNWSQKGDLILRGGCFEIGRCNYWYKFPGPGIISNVPGVDSILNGFKEEVNPALFGALAEWIDWTRQTQHQDLDWRDRFYLEQRLAGWLSFEEQSLDLIDAEKFYIANSHYYFAHVLRVPEEKRCFSQHQIDLIERMAPELNKFPFNPVSTQQKVLRHLIIAAKYLRSRMRL